MGLTFNSMARCVQALSLNILKPDQTLLQTKYFTSRLGQLPDKVKRQNTYLEALGTRRDVAIYFAKYQMNPHTCRNRGFTHIAVELLGDAFLNAFDTAIPVSADSDLVAPVLAIKRLFPDKRVIVACPPDRSSAHLTSVAHGYLKIGHGSVEKSQFPEEVTTGSSFVLRRPASWK